MCLKGFIERNLRKRKRRKRSSIKYRKPLSSRTFRKCLFIRNKSRRRCRSKLFLNISIHK